MVEVVSEDLILVGEVKGPHGLKGLLRATSFARSEKSFTEAGIVVARIPSAGLRPFRVLYCGPHRKGVVLGLEGIESRDEAERLRGAELFFRKEDLKRQEEDEFFWFEVIGLKVYSEEGEFIGLLSGVIPTGGTDIFVVSDGKREVLIPAAREIIKDIDTTAKTMVVNQPGQVHEV